MIGLKRGTVKILPHNKEWHAAFEKEEKNLKKKLGRVIVDIQHIGSTAVSGLHAKPIIDMSLGLKRLKDSQKLIKPLYKLGYKFYKKFGWQTLFAKGPDRKRTHYLHVMKYNGAKWKSDLAFREHLIHHPKRVKAYSALKKKLAKQYPNDREKYSAGKKKFIEETIRLGQLKS